MPTRLRRVLSLLALLVAASAGAAEPEVDAFSGLKMAGDWELVRNNCVACHSARLITQQWLGMIRWMQEKQNLWQFDPEVESRIVAYLAEYYPPAKERRRGAIPPDLMPPNPYAPTTDSSNPL